MQELEILQNALADAWDVNEREIIAQGIARLLDLEELASAPTVALEELQEVA